jgi:hypothetical protein
LQRLNNYSKVLSRFATTALVVLVATLGFAGLANGAGSATLTLDPSSGSYNKDATFTVTVHETSTDQINAVEADMAYDTAKLQFISASVNTSVFDLTIPNSNGGGSVKLTAAKSGGSVTGNQIVGTVTFKALAGSGSTPVTFASSSQIVRTSDTANVWNGNPAGGSYTLTGDSSGGGSTGGTSGGGSTTSKSKSSSTSKTTKTTQSATPVPPATTAPTTSTDNPSVPTYYVGILVKSTGGHPLKDASVTIDGQTSKTISTGLASFTAIPAGEHTVTVTYGNKKASQTITVSSNGTPQDLQQFSVVMAVKTTADYVKMLAIILLLLLILGGGIGAGLVLLKRSPKLALPGAKGSHIASVTASAGAASTMAPTHQVVPDEISDDDINPSGQVFYPDPNISHLTPNKVDEEDES